MPSELLIAVIAGIGGMLGWGLADFFAKKTIDELGDVMTLAWAGIFGTLAFLVACVVAIIFYEVPVEVPSSPVTWSLLAFFGVLQAAVYIFAYRGFGKGQVGLLAPVFASFSGIVALVSIFFLGEPATNGRLIALAIVFAGILLLNADFSALSKLKVGLTRISGFGDVFIATILAAIWTILWQQFLGGQNWLFYAFYMFVIMTIAVFTFAYIRHMRFSVSRVGLWKFVFYIGVCEVIAYIAISLGYSVTPYVSVVAVLSGAFALPTIVLARMFLNERPSRTQTVASLVVVLGTVLLAML